MNKALQDDLEDAGLTLESMVKRLDKMSKQEQIDLAARLKGIAKNIEIIDRHVKDNVKEWRKGKMGYVLGDVFKAYLNEFPVTRLNQKKLEVEEPTIFAKYRETAPEVRVTFEPR